MRHIVGIPGMAQDLWHTKTLLLGWILQAFRSFLPGACQRPVFGCCWCCVLFCFDLQGLHKEACWVNPLLHRYCCLERITSHNRACQALPNIPNILQLFFLWQEPISPNERENLSIASDSLGGKRMKLEVSCGLFIVFYIWKNHEYVKSS